MSGSPGRYRSLEHTADAGFEIEASSRTEVFVLALEALTDCLTDLTTVEPLQDESVSLCADALDLLLVDWLQELLYLFETRGLVARTAKLRLRPAKRGDFRLEGTILGEPFDPERHPVKLPVKAVTYHQLAFEPAGDGFYARVILDV